MAEESPKPQGQNESQVAGTADRGGESLPPSGDDQLARAEQRLGEVLANKWTLRRVLGVGGMAAVYEAEHRNQSRVAIKMLHSELSRDSNVTRRFRQEGYAGNSIQHPGVLRVLDDDQAADGSAFLVMDLLIGSSLEDILLARGRLEPVQVALVADQVLDILEAAHARGVIHRDIKPDNIFITAAGDVKLLDFGIASVRQSSSKTTMGSFMGTPAFCPPEQARGRWSDVDQRSDLWALGATMFTALSGHAVHEGETVTEVLALAVQSRAPKLLDVAPDAHPELALVIDRALEYEKQARYAQAAEFRDALQALETRLPPATAGLADLVNPDAVSQTSGTLLRRPKRAFGTPDPSLKRPLEATQIGLGPAAESLKPNQPSGSPRRRSGLDAHLTAAPTTVSGVPQRRRPHRAVLIGVAVGVAGALVGLVSLLRDGPEPEAALAENPAASGDRATAVSDPADPDSISPATRPEPDPNSDARGLPSGATARPPAASGGPPSATPELAPSDVSGESPTTPEKTTPTSSRVRKPSGSALLPNGTRAPAPAASPGSAAPGGPSPPPLASPTAPSADATSPDGKTPARDSALRSRH